MNPNGSQTTQIKAILDGKYANMVTDYNEKRFTGIIVGGVIGILLGTITRQKKKKRDLSKNVKVKSTFIKGGAK